MISEILKSCNPYFTSKYVILTALLTGMGPGKIGGLTWDDINFIFNTISINQSWNVAKKDFKPLKTKASKELLKSTIGCSTSSVSFPTKIA